jgi:hypothetical protein
MVLYLFCLVFFARPGEKNQATVKIRVIALRAKEDNQIK